MLNYKSLFFYLLLFGTMLLINSCSKDKPADLIPTITKIQSGRLGDVIEIDGSNFESKRLQVFFDNEESGVSYITDKKVKVRIPRTIERYNPKLVIVDLKENLNLVEEIFELVTPKITGYEQQEVTFDEEFTILGENFDKDEDYVSVKLNGEKANVIYSSYDKIIIKIPHHIIESNIKVTVNAQLQDVESNDHISLKKPIIDSVSENYYANGTLIIQGQNFHPSASYGKVFVDGVEGRISSSSKNELRITTPEGPYIDFIAHELKYELANHSIMFDLNKEIQNNSVLVDFNPGYLASKPIQYNGKAYAYFQGIEASYGYKYSLYEFSSSTQKWIEVPGTEFEGYVVDDASNGQGNLFISRITESHERELFKVDLTSFSEVQVSLPFTDDEYDIKFLYFQNKLYLLGARRFSGNIAYSVDKTYEYDELSDSWSELISGPLKENFESLSSSFSSAFEHEGILYFNHSPQSAVWHGYRLLPDLTMEEYGSVFYFQFKDAVFQKYYYYGGMKNFFNDRPGIYFEDIEGRYYFVLDDNIYFQGDEYNQHGKGTYKIKTEILNELL